MFLLNRSEKCIRVAQHRLDLFELKVDLFEGRRFCQQQRFQLFRGVLQFASRAGVVISQQLLKIVDFSLEFLLSLLDGSSLIPRFIVQLFEVAALLHEVVTDRLRVRHFDRMLGLHRVQFFVLFLQNVAHLVLAVHLRAQRHHFVGV